MPGLSPFVQNINFTDDKGQNIWNSGAMPTGAGIQGALNYGSGVAQSAIMQRAMQMVASGATPTTPAEAAAMEQIYAQRASQQEQQNLQTQMMMLGGGASAGASAPEGGRGFMGMNGLPATFRPGPPPPAATGGSVFNHPNGGTAYQMAQSSAPADGPRGAVGGGTSSGATGGGFANNQQLHGEATGSLLRLLQNPGMSERTVDGMISRGADEISEQEKQARLDMRANAAAGGGGEGGDYIAASNALASQTGSAKAGQARDIRLGAETDRLNRHSQTLNTAFSFLGSVEDRAAADARFQQQMQRDDRNAMMSLLASNKPQVPDYSALASLAGATNNRFTLPFGGGANQGGGPGSATAGQPLKAGGANQGAGPGAASMAPAPNYSQPAAPAARPGYANTGGSYSPSQGGQAYKPPAAPAAPTAYGPPAPSGYSSPNAAVNTDPHNPFYSNRPGVAARSRGLAAYG